MEDNVFELESSLKQLEIKQEDVCTIWAYGALKVIKHLNYDYVMLFLQFNYE